MIDGITVLYQSDVTQTANWAVVTLIMLGVATIVSLILAFFMKKNEKLLDAYNIIYYLFLWIRDTWCNRPSRTNR